MRLAEFEKLVSSKHSKNFYFVNVKREHTCRDCNKVIVSGEKCLTINKKGNGRKWLCCDCVQHKINMKEADLSVSTKYRRLMGLRSDILSEMDSLPFDDDGEYMALADLLSEVEGEIEDLGL